jgi:hypothetical protein
MALVLKITLGILLAAVILVMGCGALIAGTADEISSEIEKSGVADYGENDRPMSAAAYKSIKIGDHIESVMERFGEPQAIVRGAKISTGTDDVYAWKIEGGALLDTYEFDVNPKTGKITLKMRL